MKIRNQNRSGRSASALLAVLILAAIVTMVAFASGQRTAELQRELGLVEARQKARLEQLHRVTKTNQTGNGQNTRH
jgi:hypothetical protein